MEVLDEVYLEHFGVKGMHWGIRRGKGTTGYNRVRGAKSDKAARMAGRRQAAVDGKRFRALTAIGSAYMGREEVNARLTDSIDRLNRQEKRVTTGRVTIEDRLDMLNDFLLPPALEIGRAHV